MAMQNLKMILVEQWKSREMKEHDMILAPEKKTNLCLANQ